MPTDYEALAKMLINSPQGGKIIRGLDKFNTAISSESGRQLLTMLAGSGGDAVKSAARAAAAADKDQARILLSSLLSSKEGAALASKIIELSGV